MFLLVTGGSGSGKSAFAEDWITEYSDRKEPLFYIATMIPYGSEGKKRVARHLTLREGKGFQTVERYQDLDGLQLPAGGSVLLECMSNLTANEMFREYPAADVRAHILRGISSLRGQIGQNAEADGWPEPNLCIVTNEVFSDGIAYEAETKVYIKLLGEINQALAEEADEVVEVVNGLPNWLKKTVCDQQENIR